MNSRLKSNNLIKMPCLVGLDLKKSVPVRVIRVVNILPKWADNRTPETATPSPGAKEKKFSELVKFAKEWRSAKITPAEH